MLRDALYAMAMSLRMGVDKLGCSLLIRWYEHLL